MDTAALVLIIGAFAAGVGGALARTWALHRRVYSLEDRLQVVEGIQQREVKARAGQERWKKPDKDFELLQSLSGAPVQRKLNWWESLPKTVGKGGG